MKNNFRFIAILVIAFLSIHYTGCEPEDWIGAIDCNDCYYSEPDSANLIIKVTINGENDSVPIVVYKGHYEDGVVDWIDTATSEELYLYSELKQLYTVKATYRSGEKTVTAFDDDKMTTRRADEECGAPCYLVKGGIFEVRLKE